MLLTSLSLIVSYGGIYCLQMFIVLGKINLTVIAKISVLRLILLRGMSFLIRTVTPLKAL